MSLQISYQFTRRDYVALSCALVKQPLAKRLKRLALWLIAVLCLLAAAGWFAGMPLTEHPEMLLPDALGGTMPMSFAALLVVIAIAMLWPEGPSAVMGFLAYRSVPFADQDYGIELDDGGINISTEGASSHIDWPRLQRLIEYRSTVVLAIGPRQGLGLPLRALPPGTDRAALIAYIKARTKPDLPHVR
ncbi:YcxB family protein [Oryzibacter oryziterrae]|uniref:YcxB family protein n=1 Tax=Oryzibacter oryziterrae TaxID=2766474 RepID=UPI001F3FC626|nr:YcxB family protein [Oryzibacter oryziterrae]